MNLILEVTTGPDAPRSFVIEPGAEVQVGRAAPAQILLAGDRSISRRHFALMFDGKRCRIRDLGSSYGTTVNGLPVSESLLTDGDLIGAGITMLRVDIGHDLGGEAPLQDLWPTSRLEPVTPVAGGVGTQEQELHEPTLRDRVLEFLRSQQSPLFAILDAARGELVHLRIHECPEQKQSLYEGPQAARLSFFAPYLVSLPSDSPFLERLVHEGWGKNWGVYLTCELPFQEVRKHLRQFLTAQLEGGEKVLFRFYDPRVLRIFLANYNPCGIGEFFGPIGRYCLESEDSLQLLVVTPTHPGVRCEAIQIADSDAATASKT
jgi:hypothetical protein